MNTFRKMVLLSTDDYNKYRNLMYTSQVTPSINPMQKEMEGIKEKYGDNLPEDQRNKLESEIIQKYSDKIDITSPSPKVDGSKLEWIKTSLEDFSKTNKTRANQLYNLLSMRLSDRWNENGELLTVDGEPIKGSNILDLVNYVTSSNKAKNAPYGFNDFKQLLSEANVPSYVFSKRGMVNINKQDSIPNLHKLVNSDDDEHVWTSLK